MRTSLYNMCTTFVQLLHNMCRFVVQNCTICIQKLYRCCTNVVKHVYTVVQMRYKKDSTQLQNNLQNIYKQLQTLTRKQYKNNVKTQLQKQTTTTIQNTCTQIPKNTNHTHNYTKERV